MNKLKFILKGILLYTTIICTILFVCMFDSTPKVILVSGFILLGLYMLCYIFLNQEDIIKLINFTKL